MTHVQEEWCARRLAPLRLPTGRYRLPLLCRGSWNRLAVWLRHAEACEITMQAGTGKHTRLWRLLRSKASSSQLDKTGSIRQAALMWRRPAGKMRRAHVRRASGTASHLQQVAQRSDGTASTCTVRACGGVALLIVWWPGRGASPTHLCTEMDANKCTATEQGVTTL